MALGAVRLVGDELEALVVAGTLDTVLCAVLAPRPDFVALPRLSIFSASSPRSSDASIRRAARGFVGFSRTLTRRLTQTAQPFDRGTPTMAAKKRRGPADAQRGKSDGGAFRRQLA